MKNSKEHNGYTITVNWDYDPDMGPPWEESDGHGIVSEWTHRDAEEGEEVLVSDRSSRRYYDFNSTMEKAKKEGWGLSPDAVKRLAKELGRKPTPTQIRKASVQSDFDYLSDWCNDRWHWMCRDVRIEGMDYRDSLCGIDGTDETIKDYTEEAFNEAIAWLDRELAERENAECRDIATV